MANIVLFPMGEIPKYLRSVNTPDYESNPNAVINPDLTGLVDENKLPIVPVKYWKRNGEMVEEMTQLEKDTYETNLLNNRKTTLTEDNVNISTLIKTLIQIGNQNWSKGQTVTKAYFLQELQDNLT